MLRISNLGLTVALTLLIALLFVNGVLTNRNTNALSEDAKLVQHSHQVIEAIADVRSAINDAETGQRGYLLTGNDLYLEPYKECLAVIGSTLDKLSSMLGQDGTQLDRLVELRRLIDEKLGELDEVVSLRKQAGFDPAREAVLSGRGRRMMEAIRDQIHVMRTAEESLLRLRSEHAASTFERALLSGQISAGATIVLFLCTVLLIRRNVAARTRAALSLEEQHDLLRTTLASIVEGIVVTDARGRVTYLNPVAEVMTGRKQDEAVGRPIEEVYRVVDEESGAVVENAAVRAMSLDSPQGGSLRKLLRTHGGGELAIDDSAAPLRARGGAVIGAVLAFRDVTLQRRTEREIAGAKAFAESTVDTIPDPLIILDREWRVRSANLSFYELFRVREAETAGMPLMSLADERWNQPAVRALLEEVAATGRTVRGVEVEQELPHLGRRTLVLSARGLRGTGEHANLILLAVQDETETRANERRIQELLKEAQDNASRMRQIAAASLTLNSAHSREAVLDVLREEARRILGVDEAVVTLDPTPPRTGGSVLSAPLTGRGGQLLGHVLLRGAALRGERLTESDESMLQQLAHVASVAIENARLYEELRDGDRRKDEFLATLAHELRNPLAPVRNSVQILRSPRADEKSRDQALVTIERQIALLVRLVDDLLDVSRITRGKVALKKQHVELSEIIGQALEISRPVVHASGNTLSVQLPTEPVVLDADPSRMAQVLSNLLNNAAKYTERGGHIWLTCHVQDRDLSISVRDDGMGIPGEMLPHIFDMFWQLEHALERAQGGLGIGLSLVRQLVDMHGGRVEARSAGPGTGSEFVVHLALPPAALPGPAPAPVRIEAAEPEALATQRILVVDDNHDSAESLALLLRLRGHEVRTAHDGLHAVDLAAEFAPEVVLLDIGLPGMNGYDAARGIRAHLGSDVTIVAMTGWGQAEDRRRSSEAGFDHHLVKPVDHELLRRIIAGA